jgi:hypothetical protein
MSYNGYNEDDPQLEGLERVQETLRGSTVLQSKHKVSGSDG